MSIKNTFNNKLLYKYRLEKNMTQSELGNELGISVQTIISYESGKSVPKVKCLIRIADFFDKDIRCFFNTQEG